MSVYPDAGDIGINNFGSFYQKKSFNVVPLNKIGLGKEPVRIKPQ